MNRPRIRYSCHSCVRLHFSPRPSKSHSSRLGSSRFRAAKPEKYQFALLKITIACWLAGVCSEVFGGIARADFRCCVCAHSSERRPMELQWGIHVRASLVGEREKDALCIRTVDKRGIEEVCSHGNGYIPASRPWQRRGHARSAPTGCFANQAIPSSNVSQLTARFELRCKQRSTMPRRRSPILLTTLHVSSNKKQYISGILRPTEDKNQLENLIFY